MSILKHYIPFLQTFMFIAILALTQDMHTQEDNYTLEFNEAMHIIINENPTAFNTLEDLFKAYKKDSLKMKRLAATSSTINYNEGESYAFIHLGNIDRNISKYKSAINYHEKANELALSANNINLRIISLNMLGVDYRRMDLLRSALDYHAQALKLAHSVETTSTNIKRSIAVSQNSMGNIYLALKQYDPALNQFNKSLIIEQEVDNKLGLAINYHNIGYAKEGKGLLTEALSDYEKSLDYNNQINSDVGRAICLNSIGEIYVKQGDYDKAMDFITRALEKAELVNDQFYIASSNASLGWVLSKQNNLNTAEEKLNKAIRLSTKYNLKLTEAEARKHLAEVNKKQGKFDAALDQYQNASAIENNITSGHNLNYVNDLIVKYESESKSNTIKALTDENEIVKSRLERFQTFLIIAASLLLISGVVFLVYSRNTKLRQEKKILTLEQDMLRSQMNPHFIFNSLNSIKLYIINNEKENAVYYLNKFAKLIRKILVASKEKDIQLSEELDTMALYMNIENIRFSNEIDFKINIDDSVKPEGIRVPSLILQPFLENALWHGLSSKKEDKKIKLNVTQKSNKYVTISIEDNGIGREASRSIRSKKTLKRKSVGIALTKERLENFSKGFNNNYSIHIEDLYEDKNPSGTKVIIDIPIREMVLKTA